MSHSPSSSMRRRSTRRSTKAERTVLNLGEEQALAWFVRLNRPNVDDDQRMAFNRWLGLDPANRRSYAAVLNLWQRLGLAASNLQRV